MKLAVVIRAILRELFDESAYERFCAREKIPPGRDSYRRFLDELSTTRSARPRCC